MRAPLVLSLLLVGCPKKTATNPAADGSTEQPQESPVVTAPTTPEEAVTWAMDPEANACDDFYQYACGGWIEKTELPGDKARYSRSFSVILDRNQARLKTILEEATANPGDDADAKLIGAAYGACMDTEAIEASGSQPIQEAMSMAGTVRTPADVWATQARLQKMGIDPLYGTFVDQDFKNPDVVLLQLVQGGLSLPDREYYLSDDEQMTKVREGFQAHVKQMFILYGKTPDEAEKYATRVMWIEKQLAEAAVPRQELRDPDKTYNKLDRAGLKKKAPKFDLDQILNILERGELDGINVMTPDFFPKMADIATERPQFTAAYYQWHVLHHMAPHLSKPFVDETHNFFGKTLSGQQEQEDRWKRCVRYVDGAVGHPLAKRFVAKHFPGESKDLAIQMLDDLETAFIGGLPGLEWMDDATRARAEEKAKAITRKIGYPDTWRDYSEVSLGDNHVDNYLNATAFNIDYYLDQVGKAPNPDHWYMTPPTVNAYYNPGQNEIAFPAGILQDPFFDKDFPAAMNYGAIGMVIGHEITHGFDDGGRKFDKDGRLSEWWEPEVSKRFEERAECVEKQYDSYEVLPGHNVNGKLTLGENIADLGGIKQAVRAYRLQEARNGAAEEFAGHTGEQLVYLAYAQGWCSIRSEEESLRLLKADSHSPPRFRVNGALRNLPDFGEAFGCEEGSNMRPTDMCEVW